MLRDALSNGAWVRTLCHVLFYVALPLALITTNVRFAFSEERVYKYSIDQYDAPLVTGISRADLIAATQDIRAYFTNSEDLLRTKVHDANGTVVPLFNTREVLHMRDVKTLVHRVYGLETLALCLLLAYVVATVIWSGEETLRRLCERLLRAAAGTVALVLAFGVLAMTGGFDALFLRFHELSFGNDFWQLDPARDHLVQMFPEGFWLDATLLIAGLTVLEAVLIGAAAWFYLRYTAPAARSSAQTQAAQQNDRPEDVPQPAA